MKTIMSDLICPALVIVLGVIALLLIFNRKTWLKISRRILKPYFDIETRAYKKWHDKRAARIQKALDREHSVNYDLNIITL